MSITETDSRNLENDVLKRLKNRTVIADLMNQVEINSKILPHIQIYDIPGDTVKIVGLTSNKPVQFTWDYKEKEFGPSEAVIYKDTLSEKDKWIFYYVFSEPIEKLAIDPEKLAGAIKKQTNQVGYDIADFYDNDVVENYICDPKRYAESAKVKLNALQLQDVQLVGEILITTGLQMTVPSTTFNVRKSRTNVRDTKQLLCFLNIPVYSKMLVASTYKTPSPVLEVLRSLFTVIPIDMKNCMQAALVDSKGLALAQFLNKRYLKLDEYVASHKVLDHLWRKWLFVDYRPAFALFSDDSIKSELPKNNKDEDSDEGENKDLAEYLRGLKETFSNFVNYDSGDEIKNNSKNFWKKVAKELKNFDETGRKTGLTNMLSEINPGSEDSNKKGRFEDIEKALKEKSLVD